MTDPPRFPSITPLDQVTQHPNEKIHLSYIKALLQNMPSADRQSLIDECQDDTGEKTTKKPRLNQGLTADLT